MTTPVPWTAGEIADATKGVILFGEKTRSFSGISIDSRTISGNAFFVAIKGTVHDGHRFIRDVIERGGRGFLIEKKKSQEFLTMTDRHKESVCIAVGDTTEALGDLAAFHRKRLDVPTIAITGSNGKTTTRKMTAACVSKRYSVLETVGNFNNQIGLPLTLLRLEKSHEWAVLELGMNQPGEIRRLAEICRPDIGVITNIGPAHLEGFGSMEGIMHAKGELLEKIKPDGAAVLNADDPRVLYLASKATQNVFLFGSGGNAAVRAEAVKKSNSGTVFRLVMPSEQLTVGLKLPGTFMVPNALAAASVGYLLGLSGREIKTGLEEFEPASGRMNIFSTGAGIHIIDDTYNANPDSMKAAIETLRSLKGSCRGILIVGDMLELGDFAETMHKNIGALSADSDVARLYAAGTFAETVAKGAAEQGMNPEYIFTGTKDEIVSNIKGAVQPGDWVLVKGSRGMGMEEIVHKLKTWANGR